MRLAIRFAGDGLSTYWYENVIFAMGFVAAAPYAFQILGEALEAGGNLVSQLSASMTVTGSWLKSVAWRLSPKNPNDSSSRKPDCFGHKDQLDRRYKRCRDCGFLGDCQVAITERQNP